MKEERVPLKTGGVTEMMEVSSVAIVPSTEGAATPATDGATAPEGWREV